jgi:RHS repeat-associated protein
MTKLLTHLQKLLPLILLLCAGLGLGLLAPGQAQAGETITYIHADIASSPIAATNAAGVLLWNESYRPYGARSQNTDQGKQAQWFTGKSLEASTGLSYFGARYYDPVVGRFMGVDPVGFMQSNLHSFNRYAYGNNNPYKFVDPDGRQAVGASFPNIEAEFKGYQDAMISVYTHAVLMATGEGVLVALGEGAAALRAVMYTARATRQVEKTGVAVTDDTIRAALITSELKTTQSAVSKPIIENYVRRLEAGEIAPAIKIDGNVIVDGNHRYVAGRLVGREPASTSGFLSPSQAAKAKPVQNLIIDSINWGF